MTGATSIGSGWVLNYVSTRFFVVRTYILIVFMPCFWRARPLVSYLTDYIVYTWNPSLPRIPLTLKFLYRLKWFSDWYTTIPPPHRIESYFDVTYVKVSNEIFYCIYDLSRFLGLHVHRSYQMRENSYWIEMPMSL